MMLGRTGVGTSTHGQLYELDAIAAVVVGGTLLIGGRGTIMGTVLGVLIFSTLTNVFTQNNLSTSVQAVTKGAIIVVAVLLQQRFAARGTRIHLARSSARLGSAALHATRGCAPACGARRATTRPGRSARPSCVSGMSALERPKPSTSSPGSTMRSPVTPGERRQIGGHRRRVTRADSPRLETHLAEPDQPLHRAHHRRDRVVQVELHDLGSRAVARVAHRERRARPTRRCAISSASAARSDHSNVVYPMPAPNGNAAVGSMFDTELADASGGREVGRRLRAR